MSQCYVTVAQLGSIPEGHKTALSCRIYLPLKPGYAHWGVQCVDCGIALSDYCFPLCHFWALHPSQHSSLVEMGTSFSLHAQTHSFLVSSSPHSGVCEADVRFPCRLCWVLDTLSSRWDAELKGVWEPCVFLLFLESIGDGPWGPGWWRSQQSGEYRIREATFHTKNLSLTPSWHWSVHGCPRTLYFLSVSSLALFLPVTSLCVRAAQSVKGYCPWHMHIHTGTLSVWKAAVGNKGLSGWVWVGLLSCADGIPSQECARESFPFWSREFPTLDYHWSNNLGTTYVWQL